jgi:hypothetical protein
MISERSEELESKKTITRMLSAVALLERRGTMQLDKTPDEDTNEHTRFFFCLAIHRSSQLFVRDHTSI